MGCLLDSHVESWVSSWIYKTGKTKDRDLQNFLARHYLWILYWICPPFSLCPLVLCWFQFLAEHLGRPCQVLWGACQVPGGAMATRELLGLGSRPCWAMALWDTLPWKLSSGRWAGRWLWYLVAWGQALTSFNSLGVSNMCSHDFHRCFIYFYIEVIWKFLFS